MATVNSCKILVVLLLVGTRVGSISALYSEEDDLLPGNYFTMVQTFNRTPFTLKVRLDGSIEWKPGEPTLYSVLREQVVQDRSSGERMYSLEAVTTQHWICMNGKGRLYTVRRPPLIELKSNGKYFGTWGKIRHLRKKGSRGGRRRPPSDCFFQTFEFNPNESYEQVVGIYSYSHSNNTHGRFLSRNPNNGRARTYRRAFEHLNQYPQVKIVQVPIRFLKDMITVTKFHRATEHEYNGRVRNCLLLLINCPNHREKIKLESRKRQHHFYKIIERCRRRAVSTSALPKCLSNKRKKTAKLL